MAATVKGRTWLHVPEVPTENEEDGELLVFGYSCKLFRDDEKALNIDQGKHLIPWMGDESHMIDRYDGRGYIHDLRQYEPIPGRDLWEELSADELQLESVIDEARYAALKVNLAEEDLNHEEELKRLRAALADDGVYNQVGFSYEDGGSGGSSEPLQKGDGDGDSSPGDEPDVFVPAEVLNIPKGMEVPSSGKLNAIVEKTALFVVRQGPQMEIVIKTKQASNPQFAFLAFDHSLNPYYKHVIQMIKQGKYIPKPQPTRTHDDDDDDDDDGDGHYLHPSLLSAKKEMELNVPKLNYTWTGDDRYSLLVSRLKDKIQVDIQPPPPPPPPPPPLENSVLNGSESSASVPPASVSSEATVVPPPPPGLEPVMLPDDSPEVNKLTDDLLVNCDPATVTWPPCDLISIVDKMASYVAKNGEHFEAVVKAKSAGADPRFDFLNVGHVYHAYYQLKRKLFEKESAAAAAAGLSTPALDDGAQEKELKTGVVSFSIRMKDVVEKLKVGPLGSDGEAAPSEDQFAKREDEIVAEPTEYEKSLKAKLEEARLAEQKIKDRLAAAARERLAQANREKQLQLERKRKAALFLTMLRKDKEDDDPNLIGPRLPTAIEMTQMIIREDSPPLALALAGERLSMTVASVTKAGRGGSVVAATAAAAVRTLSSPQQDRGRDSRSPAARPSSHSHHQNLHRVRSRSRQRHGGGSTRHRSESREQPRREGRRRSRSPRRHQSPDRSTHESRRNKSSGSRSPSHGRHRSCDRDSKEKGHGMKTPPAAYATRRRLTPSPKRHSRSSRSRSRSHSKHRRDGQRRHRRRRRLSSSRSPPSRSRSGSRRRSKSGSRGGSKGKTSKGRSASPRRKKS